MTQDEQHLDLLAIFHYIVGGLTALFSCIFLLHVAMGIAMRRWILAAAMLSAFSTYAAEEQIEMKPPPRVEKSLDIAEVPADFPVGFCLLTHGRRQYVAYYNKYRCMTVASRTIDSNEWQYQVLPSKVGWDGHNYITMAMDDGGYLHLSGNMHGVPLIYFRTSAPWNIATLKQLPAMTGKDEKLCTYPAFLRDANNRLIFHYRDGESGNGNEIYNVYDLETKTWKRLLDKPLTDGKGKMCAYFLGPLRGPDGWFHIVWVWRDTAYCETNHHLSYARSRDLIHWESASGKKANLPITLNNKSLWVDPIPSGGGIINNCQKLAFDQGSRPIVTYHKSDTNGNMQVYATRFENGNWVQHRLTDWSKPVKFSGAGSMNIGIEISGLTRVEPGTLTMTYGHTDYGSGHLVIDEATLGPINKKIAITKMYPDELERPQIDFEGIVIQRAGDIGSSGEEGVQYILQWETLPVNQDLPHERLPPTPSMLKLYKLSSK